MPASVGGPRSVLERLVTASPQEFERGLRTAFPDAVQGGPEWFRATYEGTVMEVELTPRAPRVLGRLALPVLAVRIRFPVAGAGERAAMLARMDRAMHRGGG